MAKNTFSFTVDSQLMGELGERLVSKNYIALAELIKNSYDADATEVSITLENAKSEDFDEEGRITIEDDGHGMSTKDVEDKWMRIATTNKRYSPVSPKYGRPKTGRKGIGRFACQRLAKELQLVTAGLNAKQQIEKTSVLFKWQEKFNPGENLEGVEFEYSRELDNKSKKGTVLRLKKLLDKWGKRDFNVLKRQILLLSMAKDIKRKNFDRDPGMTIFIMAPEFEDTHDVVDLFQEFRKAGWGLISASVNKSGKANLKLEAKDIGVKKYELAEKFNKLKDVEISISWVPTKSHLQRRPDILKKYVTEEIQEFSGIKVYQNNFRIPPYGDYDNDWLKINQDQARSKGTPTSEILYTEARRLDVAKQRPLLYMPRTNALYGQVFIKGQASNNFEQKSDREGLVEENDAFKELQRLTRICVEWATLWYAVFALNRKEKEFKKAEEEFEGSLADAKRDGKVTTKNSSVKSALDYIKSGIEDSESSKNDNNKLNYAINFVEEYFDKTEAQLNLLRNVASVNSIMLTFSHEVRSLISKIDDHSSEIKRLKRDLPPNKKGKADSISLELENTKNRLMSQINLFGFLGQKDSSTKKYKYKVKSILDNIIYSFNFILKKYSINVQTDIKGKVHTPLMFEQELYTIVINVLSNAIKAVLASEGVDILIQAEETKEGFRLAVYDGGVGLSGEFKEKVFMPLEVDPDNKIYPALKGLKDGDLFSFGQGTGLGLSIVKDIVEGYNGEIKFVNPEKPWVTCVEVFLPW